MHLRHTLGSPEEPPDQPIHLVQAVLQPRHRLLNEDRGTLFHKMTWTARKSPVLDATMSESTKAELLVDIEDVHERQPQRSSLGIVDSARVDVAWW